MANKRDASRQKRARSNRAQREALEARRKAASTPKTERPVSATSGGSARAGAQVEAGGTKATGGRQAGSAGRVARLGQVPVDPETLEGSWLRRVAQVPGGLQVVMAATLVLVLTVMSAVMHTIPPDGAPKGAAGTRTLFDVYGFGALLILGPPVILVGNALLFSLHARRRRMWTMSAILLGGFSLLAPQFLFPAGFLGYAVLRARQVEDGRTRPPRRRRGTAAGSGDADRADGSDGGGSDADPST